METTFISRKIAKKFRPRSDSAIISIFTPGDKRAWLFPGWKYIHCSCFFDVDAVSESAIYPAITKAQAHDMVNFIDICANNHIGAIICHCDAGISRSAGVAMFIKDAYNADLIIVQNPADMYNRLVYRELMEASGRSLVPSFGESK